MMYKTDNNFHFLWKDNDNYKLTERTTSTPIVIGNIFFFECDRNYNLDFDTYLYGIKKSNSKTIGYI